VLHRVAVCCSELQSVAVSCNELQQCVALFLSSPMLQMLRIPTVCCRVLQRIAVSCSDLQCVAESCSVLVWSSVAGSCIVLQCAVVCCCSVLQSIALSCSVLQRVALDHLRIPMGWLRLVGCFKIQVSFQNTGLFCRALLQKRPIFLSILLIVATPYSKNFLCEEQNQITKNRKSSVRTPSLQQ